jgi:hypothetical protein
MFSGGQQHRLGIVLRPVVQDTHTVAQKLASDWLMKSCTGSVGKTRLDLTAGKPLGKVPLTKTEMQRRWRAKVRRRLLFAEHRDPAALRTPRARPEDKEFWPTPPCLRAALTGWVIPSLPAGVVWEAAAGFGHLADDIEATTGRQVIATDIDPQRHGIGRHDFHDAPAGNGRHDPGHQSAVIR